MYISVIGFKQVPSPGAIPSVVAASNEDFVIKQHTYQMCPNCPTFSIPIPVPKSAASQVSEVRFPLFSGKMLLTIPPKVVNPYTIDPGYEYQHGEEPVSLFSRLSSLLSPIFASARASLAPLLGDSNSNSLEPSTFSDRLSTVGSEKHLLKSQRSPSLSLPNQCPPGGGLNIRQWSLADGWHGRCWSRGCCSPLFVDAAPQSWGWCWEVGSKTTWFGFKVDSLKFMS